MNKEEFINELKKLNIEINTKQLSDLDKFYQLLYQENQKYNLTAITEEREVYLKHFYDSLTIVKSVTLNTQYILDIGSGAGFPGLVLKIMFPNIKIDLLDATEKKCKFLKLVIDNLNLKDINVVYARAEEYAINNRNKYDVVTSRAVAPLKHLLEYGIPMLKIKGTFIALKSNLESELTNISTYYQKLGLKDESIINFLLPLENSKRSLYKITKIKETPLIYPRKYSQILKKDI